MFSVSTNMIFPPEYPLCPESCAVTGSIEIINEYSTEWIEVYVRLCYTSCLANMSIVYTVYSYVCVSIINKKKCKLIEFPRPEVNKALNRCQLQTSWSKHFNFQAVR